MARTPLASAIDFAHLIGLGRGSAAKPKVEEDERKKRDGETEEEYQDRLDKLDEDAKATVGKPKSQDEDEEMEEIDDARKRREDESDEDYSDRIRELDETQAKSTKLDGDDSSDELDEKDAKASAARRRERARCAAIFSTKEAGEFPEIAARKAFNTTLTRSAAIAELRMDARATRARINAAVAQAAPAAAAQPQRRGMQTPPNPDVGPDAGRKTATGPTAFAEKVMQADKVRRGEA